MIKHQNFCYKFSKNVAASHKPGKVLVVLFFAAFYDINEVGREDERDAFSFHSKFALEVAEDVAEVDVKHLQQTAIWSQGNMIKVKVRYLTQRCSTMNTCSGALYISEVAADWH